MGRGGRGNTATVGTQSTRRASVVSEKTVRSKEAMETLVTRADTLVFVEKLLDIKDDEHLRSLRNQLALAGNIIDSNPIKAEAIVSDTRGRLSLYSLKKDFSDAYIDFATTDASRRHRAKRDESLKERGINGLSEFASEAVYGLIEEAERLADYPDPPQTLLAARLNKIIKDYSRADADSDILNPAQIIQLFSYSRTAAALRVSAESPEISELQKNLESEHKALSKIATVGGRSPIGTVAVFADKSWAGFVSSGVFSGNVGGVQIAGLNHFIALPPEYAREALGDKKDVLLHEMIHQTQPTETELPDSVDVELLEAVTQTLTETRLRNNSLSYREGIYDKEKTILKYLLSEIPGNSEELVETLSSKSSKERIDFLSQALFGEPNPEAFRKLWNKMKS